MISKGVLPRAQPLPIHASLFSKSGDALLAVCRSFIVLVLLLVSSHSRSWRSRACFSQRKKTNHTVFSLSVPPGNAKNLNGTPRQCSKTKPPGRLESKTSQRQAMVGETAWLVDYIRRFSHVFFCCAMILAFFFFFLLGKCWTALHCRHGIGIMSLV